MKTTSIIHRWFWSGLLLLGQGALETQATPQQPTIATKMNQAYHAFRALQPYLFEKQRFIDPDNHQTIVQLITTLQTSFHDVDAFNHAYRSKPGFQSTLHVMNEMLDDAVLRFRAQNKNWSLWQLKTISQYCTTCHTSYKIRGHFHDHALSQSLTNDFAKGEFYLASRQFKKAKEAFFSAALTHTDQSTRLRALRKWLIIYTRVTPHPTEAITRLRQVLQQTQLTQHEREEISEWLVSLQRWSREASSNIPRLRKAKNLLRQALGMHDPITAKIGTVELLRATALLHQALEEEVLKPPAHREALYLLGLSYTKLPLFFIDQMPEFFLEQCIREYPNTPEAVQSFKLYRDIIITSYTGSSGVHLPSEIVLKLKELHDLAYGIITISKDRP